MSTQDKSSSYFFGCGLAWWVIHVFFRPFEKVEEQLDDDLLDHIDEFSISAEEPALWLMDELSKAGVSFEKEEKKVTAHECLLIYEHHVLGWGKEIFDIAKIKSQAPKEEYQYLYYLQIGWVLQVLNILDEMINSLGAPENELSYLKEKQLFDELKRWLSKELTEMAPHFFEKQKEEIMDAQVHELYKSLGEKWRYTVEEAVEKFPMKK